MAIFDWEWGQNWAPREGQKMPSRVHLLSKILFWLHQKNLAVEKHVQTLNAGVSTDNLNANRLDPDQALPNVGPDLAGSCY